MAGEKKDHLRDCGYRLRHPASGPHAAIESMPVKRWIAFLAGAASSSKPSSSYLAREPWTSKTALNRKPSAHSIDHGDGHAKPDHKDGGEQHACGGFMNTSTTCGPYLRVHSRHIAAESDVGQWPLPWAYVRAGSPTAGQVSGEEITLDVTAVCWLKPSESMARRLVQTPSCMSQTCVSRMRCQPFQMFPSLVSGASGLSQPYRRL